MLRRLTLGLRGIGESDAKLVQTFLRFAGRTPQCAWALSESSESDLVLSRSNSASRETIPMPLDEPGVAPVVWIVERGEIQQVDGRVLHRPLQIEAFASVLRAREAELGLTAREDSTALAEVRTSVAPQPSMSGSSATHVSPNQTRKPSPAALLPSNELAGSQAPSSAQPIVPNRRIAYRLTQWPGSDLLRGRPKFIRMLGFLTREPLSVERLVVLSGMDEATCIEMLSMLEQRKLLLRSVINPEQAPPSKAGATIANEEKELHSAICELADTCTGRTSVPPASPVENGGILQRLRKRLGL